MKRLVQAVSILLLSTSSLYGVNGLEFDAKIPLGNVKGRIDHMAVDVPRQRLFVAELGNDSVAVIDLKQGKLLRRLAGFKNPQGIAYDPANDLVFVANAGDGSVRLFEGVDLTPAGRIDLGDDADNVRVDVHAKRLYVGYGSGAIAVIDPARRTKVGDIPLKAHPESFQLDADSPLLYANVPDARQIAVVDREAGKSVATWATGEARANYPMAIDNQQKRVLVVFRKPPRLTTFDMTGTVLADAATCADSDDVFVDAKRRRVYVSCGDGFLDVFESRGRSDERIAHLATSPGARTALFVPEFDRLFLAVRATAGVPAAIWVYKPVP